jgi:hypothetical protein
VALPDLARSGGRAFFAPFGHALNHFAASFVYYNAAPTAWSSGSWPDRRPTQEAIVVRRSLLVMPAIVAFSMGLASPALAANPPGVGRPSQSCQDLEPNTPGHAANSPGSPFNEPGINSVNGGVGGQHYSETSQYDVACFQASQH